jgi:hypothetical protein
VTEPIYIVIGGERLALRCTLGAAKEINAFFGSYTAAFRRLQEFDLAAYSAVVSYGTGKPLKDVENAVWQCGMPDLVRPLSDYLGLLSNGGRALTDTEDSKKGNE